MATAVVDTSVLLAVLNEEPGAELATSLMPSALFSSVNLAEFVTKLAEKGFSRVKALALVDALACEIVPFDRPLAIDTGLLRSLTRWRGLSLGDRACLALALDRGLPVYTADRPWAELDLGLDIRLIR